MPYKNRIKSFSIDEFYHSYARGTNKMVIFIDDSDYKKFMYLLKKYLTRNFKEKKVLYGEEASFPVNSVYGQVELYAFALMPNHFHLLTKNLTEKGTTLLLRRVLTSYSKYFNEKYDRQGSVFQGSFRTVPVHDERQLITVFVYITINPLAAELTTDLINYPYCSYKIYKQPLNNKWFIKSDFFKKTVDFNNFERYCETKKDDLIDYSNFL